MFISLPLKFLLLFVFCFFLSILLNSILLKFSRNLGKRNVIEGIVRWSAEQKPSLGGITFYIVFLTCYSIYTLFFEPKTGELNIQNLGILMACGIAFLMGLSDDAYNTKPLLKFSAQLLASLVLISTGTYIEIFQAEVLNYILTIFWVVAVMNSINMLDNMDGITTIVSVVITGTIIFLVFNNSIFEYNPFFATSLISVFAGLLGFLVYNWHPSKMFMGDTGSQFLGLFLAAFAIIFLWNYKDFSGNNFPTQQLTFVGLAFIIPIIDTTTVIINRLRRGQSPFVGGKDHTTHHLSYNGFSDSTVAVIVGSISLFSSAIIVAIVSFPIKWNIWVALGCFAYFGVHFFWIFRLTQKHKMRDLYNQIASKHGRNKKIEEKLDY